MAKKTYFFGDIRYACLTVCATLLCSCGIYGKYQRGETDTEDLFGAVPPSADTSASMADTGWKDMFRDSCLHALVEQALERNTDLKIARLKVQEAHISLMSAKLAYLPSVQLEPEGSLNRYINGGDDISFSLGFSSVWEIDLFGKLTNAKRGEAAALEESETYMQAVQTGLVAAVAESYYTLLMLDEQIRITSETVESWNEYIRSLHVLMKAGQADRATVNQAEAARLNAESSLLDLREQVRETENSLCSLLSMKPQHIGRGRLEDQVFPQKLSVGVPLDLLSNRPDVRQAEASLKKAFYSTNMARAAFYPDITLSGIIGWNSTDGTVISDPSAWLFQAIGSLVQPLFNRGKNVANLKISRLQQDEAMLQFRQTLLDAGTEVNDALSSWQTAREKAELDARQIEHLSDALHDTELLMEHGNIKYLEVLAARQSLLNSELSLVADRNMEIQSVITLYHALGGGLAETSVK